MSQHINNNDINQIQNPNIIDPKSIIPMNTLTHSLPTISQQNDFNYHF